MDRFLDIRIFLPDPKFRQCGDSSSSDNSIFKDNPVVNVADVFRRMRSAGTFPA